MFKQLQLYRRTATQMKLQELEDHVRQGKETSALSLLHDVNASQPKLKPQPCALSSTTGKQVLKLFFVFLHQQSIHNNIPSSLIHPSSQPASQPSIHPSIQHPSDITSSTWLHAQATGCPGSVNKNNELSRAQFLEINVSTCHHLSVQ